MVRIAICDDDNLVIEVVSKIIKENVISCEITPYLNEKNLLSDKKQHDIYILDIDLAGKNGVAVGKMIRNKFKDAIIIFLTNYDRYVFYAYEIDAFRYIRKSTMYEKLPVDIKAAVRKIEQARKGVLIKTGNSLVNVKIDCIYSIEKIGKNVEYKLISDEILQERITLKEALEKINKSKFVIIKKGVVINLDYVKRVTKYEVELVNGEIYYASRNCLKIFLDALHKNVANN